MALIDDHALTLRVAAITTFNQRERISPAVAIRQALQLTPPFRGE
jgi:hypothetical protein